MSKSKAFDDQVKSYEIRREKGDKFDVHRKDLFEGISGRVLELAPGPGFNFKYYSDIAHLTAIDISPEMLKSAKKYWEQGADVPAAFICEDIESASFEENSFDYVVSTCTFCTYDNPIRVLNNAAKWCKPDGKILLLEHGLSDIGIIRFLQNIYNPIHYKKYSCECDRDIRQIIERANVDVLSLKKPKPFAPIDFLYQAVLRPWD